MTALVIAVAALTALFALIAYEVHRMRRPAPPKTPVVRADRRMPIAEERLREAFEGPRKDYGEIFVSYEIWRRENVTRLEIVAADRFSHLNEFTRSLIVRHVWRALEKLVAGAVVVVDRPAQQWTKEIDVRFKDRGIDPWRATQLKPVVATAGAPQFVKQR